MKRFMKTFSGRCQVYMSNETVVGNCLNFSITALLRPLQKPHKMPPNYSYLLYDSEEVPLRVKGSSLKLAVEMADYCCSSKTKECKEVLLSGDFSARADFNITLDSSTTIVNGATLGKLSIEHGETIPHQMNLIKVWKLIELSL